ncbi:hypothetical protein [Pyrobaculum islandicum]|uniref:hypothetical protein n=1 Tax=Pyrobaculum islandicum TaxID=2277 RepID=UPI0014333421|nr:hypothetical protein [Pyrobaculum islandicum]
MDGLKYLLIEDTRGQAGSFTRQTHGAVPRLSSELVKPAPLPWRRREGGVERRVSAMLLTFAATRAVAVVSY